MLRKIESDAKSLSLHRDSDSMVTSDTATSISSLKRSMQFSFDKEPFVARIYQKWTRCSLKRSFYEQQHSTPDIAQSAETWKAEQRRRSQAIDKALEEDSRSLRGECNVLLLGSESKAEIAKQMRITHGTVYSAEELQDYRHAIFNTVCEYAGIIANMIKEFNMAPESDPIWGHMNYLADYVLDTNPKSSGLDPKFRAAIESIRGSSYYATLMDNTFESDLPDTVE